MGAQNNLLRIEGQQAQDPTMYIDNKKILLVLEILVKTDTLLVYF